MRVLRELPDQVLQRACSTLRACVPELAQPRNAVALVAIAVGILLTSAGPKITERHLRKIADGLRQGVN
jgi:hypothetical protein